MGLLVLSHATLLQAYIFHRQKENLFSKPDDIEMSVPQWEITSWFSVFSFNSKQGNYFSLRRNKSLFMVCSHDILLSGVLRNNLKDFNIVTVRFHSFGYWWKRWSWSRSLNASSRIWKHNISESVYTRV